MYIFSVILLVFVVVQPVFAGGSPKTIALEMTVEEYARPQPIFHHLHAGDTITVPSEGWMKRWFTMLCPQIYFPPNKVAPIREYKLLQRNGTQKFNPDTVSGGTVEVNYQVLNIIGHRMKQMPGATLRLSVSPYGASCFGEADSLGTLRMKYIRDYLISVWEITPERIVIPPLGKRKLIKNTNETWRNCQRYVRMSSDTPELLFAVKSDDIDTLCYIRKVYLQHSEFTIDSSEIDSIHVFFDLGSSAISHKSYTKFPAVISCFGHESVNKSIRPNSMRCKIILKNGDTLTALRSQLNILPTEVHEAIIHSCFDGSFIERNYSLYFGNKTDLLLSPSQVKELQTVLPKLFFDRAQTISIASSVEFGGKERQNKKITMLRAKAVEKVLRSLLPSNSRTEIVTDNKGSEEPFFDSLLPMGRNLNNCIRIKIITRDL